MSEKKLTDEELKQVSGGFGDENNLDFRQGDFCGFINEEANPFGSGDYTHGTDKVYVINFINGKLANLECYEGIWESVGIMKEYKSVNNYLYGDVELSKLKKIDKPSWLCR